MSIPPCSMAVANLMRRKAARSVDWLLLVTCVSFGELSLTFALRGLGGFPAGKIRVVSYPTGTEMWAANQR